MRRGRKPKQGKREPNGDLSRRPADVQARLNDAMDREERETIAVAIEARQRVLDVPPQQARDQMAGSFVGRLCLQRNISRVQYDAAMTWLEDAESYMWAMGSPRTPGAMNLNAVRGAASLHENTSAARRSIRRYELALKAVTERQIELRNTANLYGALSICVVKDAPIEGLVGDLRIALNALAKHYGLEGRKAA